MSYRLGVVIPVRNEALRLPATLRAIAAASLPGVHLEHLVLALNATTDDSAELAAAVAAEIGLPLEAWECPGSGKASALAYALPRLAREHPELDGLLFMDADNATDLGELRRFDLGQREVIWIGSRKVAGAEVRWPAGHSSARRFMSAGVGLLPRFLLRLPERDTQCGFKLFPTSLVAPLFGALRSRSWIFDVELLARAHAAGYPVREVGVRWTEMAGSKVRPLPDTFSSLWGLLCIRAWLWAEGRSQRRSTSGAISPPESPGPPSAAVGSPRGR